MSLRPFYLKREYPYRNGKLHGLLKEFYTSGPAGGKIRSTKEYVDGVKHGEYKYFNESGQMITCITYENGKEKGSCIP